jgi:hypothetical protein
VRRGGLVVLGDSEPGGGVVESGEDPLVASTSEARSPLPPGAVAEDGCAVGDVATVAVSGVPMEGVGSWPPAFATVPTPESTTESAPAGPVPVPIPKPAEACPPSEPVPDPVPTPATLGADGSELYEGLVRFESFAPCVTVEAMLGAGSESRAGEGPDVRAEAESEAEARSEAASEGGVKSEAGVEGSEIVAAGSRGEVGVEVAGSIESVARAETSPESGTSPEVEAPTGVKASPGVKAPPGVEAGPEVATCADSGGGELEAPGASEVAWSAAAGAAGSEAA